MIRTVEALDRHGFGVVAGPAGAVSFEGLLPGEVVALEGGRARIVTPSADRVRPPCPHAAACGGCSLQHARDSLVAAWKVARVRGDLADSGIRDVPVALVHVSAPNTRRRAVLAARRTKAGGALVGFHRRRSDEIVAVPGCLLLSPPLLAAVPAVEAMARAGVSRTGRLDVTLAETLAGVDAVVAGGKPLDAGLTAALAEVAGAFGLARIVWAGEVAVQRAQPTVAFGPARVPLPPGAFLQATAAGEAALVAAVLQATAGARRVADLFAGCGTFALPLAAGAAVHAAEGDAAMVAALRAGWRGTPGLRPLTAEVRDLFDRPLLPDELKGFDAAVIDPPRAGAPAQTQALADARVPVIAAVSCNPRTFRHDARRLVQAGYRLDWVRVVDQFRWSAHVELAARFRLPHIAPQPAEHTGQQLDDAREDRPLA